ncbi:MAG: ECF transporter S component [Oscillospiraceae bacterium]|nr:ECF transporter S component [Oscillospiraceae bacterium]
MSVVLVILACVPFFARFEYKNNKAEEIVLIAIMAALTSVSRIPFAALPSGIQPVSFLVMVTAYVFGAETGFMTGAIAAIVSNIFLGQGAWTPWQMFAWGFVGFISGILRKTPLMKNRILRMFMGFLFGFIFGMIMDSWTVLSMGANFSFSAFIFYSQTSFIFNLMHAVSNVFFITVFFSPFVKILERIKKKYGLLE